MTNYDYPAHMLTKDGRIKKSKLKAAAQWRATHSKSKKKLVCYTRTAKDGHRYVTCNHPSHKHGAAKRHTAKPKAAKSRPRNPATQPKKPGMKEEDLHLKLKPYKEEYDKYDRYDEIIDFFMYIVEHQLDVFAG